MNKPSTEIKIFVVIKNVGPEEARHILEESEKSGFKNRTISKAKVKTYANFMLRGSWVLNNDAICIDPSGALLNGQHRLHAIILSGCTVPLLFAYNMPRDHFTVMDRQIRRQAKDVLKGLGVETYGKEIAAGLNALAAYFMTGKLLKPMENIFPVEHLLPIYRKYQEAFQDAAKGYATFNLKRLPMSIYIALYVLFYSINKKVTERFFDGINKGASLEEGNPILAVRLQLENIMSLNANTRHPWAASLAIQAWNSCMLDEKRQKFRYGKDLPEINGFDKEKFLEGTGLSFNA